MPRIVDHEARRRELAASVWALIRESGLEAVTIRAVAERSGWSSGAVRHYLPTRDEILAFAAQLVVEEVRKNLEAQPLTGDPLADFRTVLLATLPQDDESRAALEIWLAFVGAAVSGQEAAQHALLYDDLHAFISDTLGEFARNGWLDTGDVAAEAIELHGLLDGLAVHLLLRQITEAEAEQAIARWLDRTLHEP